MTEQPLDAIEALLPAYALNALDDEDRALVEGALDQHPRYRQQVADYLGTVAQLASLHAPVVPSAVLRERVLASRPPVGPIGFSSWDIPVARQERRKSARVWRVGSAWAAAAALVLAVVGLGTLSLQQQQQIQDLQQHMNALSGDMEEAELRLLAQQALVYWIAQPNVSTVALRAANPPLLASLGPRQGEARGLLMRSSNGETVLIAMDLPVLPEYFSYQGWIWASGGQPHSLGIFEVDENGYAQVLVDYPRLEGNVYLMTVSVEPAGGSVSPSGQTVLRGIPGAQ